MRPLRALPAIDGVPALALIAAAALASFAVQSYVWPLAAGRDWQDYLLWWEEVWRREPLFPALMAWRTALAPLVFGPLFSLGDAGLAEVGAGALYAASVVLWVAAARPYGRLAAAVVAAFLVVPPTYGLFFHQVGSDPVFGFALAVAAWLGARAVRGRSVTQFALVGVAAAALVLARPSGQPLVLALVLLPLGVAIPWRARLARAATVAGVAILCLGAYAAYNGVRYDDVTLARGGRTAVPLYRAFVVDGTVAPDNGPASRALASAIERDLVRREPYRSWGFDAAEVMAARTTWVYDDLIPLADRTWGWDDDHGHLAAVGMEAARAHPRRYLEGVLETLRELVLERYTGPPGAGVVGDPAEASAPTDAVIGPPGRGARRTPEAEAQHVVWAIALLNNWALTAPEPRFDVVGGLEPRPGELWSLLEKRDLQWRDPEDDRRYADLRRIVIDDLEQLARGPRHPRGDAPLRDLMVLTPALGWWMVAAALLWLVRRPRGLWLPLVLALGSAAVIVVTAVGVAPDRNYAVPFLPVYVFLVAAVLARSLDSGRRDRPYPPAA